MQNFETAISITDTVWGLVARVKPENFEKIYQIKYRDRDKPLILFASKIDTVKQYTEPWTEELSKLASQYWPGALTILFKRNNNLPAWINPESEYIGFRIPKSPSVMKLLKETQDDLLLSTSANASGEAPVTSYQEALKLFGKKVDLILEPESNENISNIASTIIKYDNGKLEIIRQGSIVIAGYDTNCLKAS